MAKGTTGLTDAEARLLAKKLLQLNVDAKTIANTKAEIQKQLNDYVFKTGNTEIGEVVAYAQASPPKLVSLKNEKKAVIEYKLLSEINEDYVIEKLDVKKIKEMMATDKKLSGLMRRLKIGVEQTSSYRFKHVS